MKFSLYFCSPNTFLSFMCPLTVMQCYDAIVAVAVASAFVVVDAVVVVVAVRGLTSLNEIP